MKLIWKCDVCQEQIADDKGYVEVKTGEADRVLRALQAAKDKKASESPSTLVAWSMSDILALPDKARWNVLHFACDPEPDTGYWIGVERWRTHADSLHWFTHLHETKRWFKGTDFGSLTQRILFDNNMETVS